MSNRFSTGRGMNKNKAIVIGAVTFLVVLIAVVGTVIGVTRSKGINPTQEALEKITKVDVPGDSRELTEVSTPPVGQADKNGDAHVGVDMYGHKMSIPESLTLKPKDGKGVAVPKPKAEDMRQVSNIGMKFNAPSVGLNDVTIGAVDEVQVGGTTLIEPTNFTSFFTVRNRGVGENVTRPAAERGTLYLVTHATDLGAVAPGNFLVDGGDARTNKLKEGDVVEVTGKNGEKLRYEITQARRDGKDLIAGDENVWDNKPARLVVITCFPNSVDNFLFIGKLMQT